MCYTTKTPHRLSNQDILGFITRYRDRIDLQTVTFCGGEVFLLPDFPELVNSLTSSGVFVQIITNGTVNRLSQINHPNLVNLIVSLDGLPAYHDQNRGAGNWAKSIAFMRHAQQLGFHLEVFSIVTQQNLSQIDQFETRLHQELGQALPVTYHPRKPPAYLAAHPVSHQCPATDGFSFLSPAEHRRLGTQKTVFPPPNLGCYQISLMSDGNIYGCCEGIRPIGDINIDISTLITEFDLRINSKLACVEPDFVCGLKELYVT